MNKYKLFSALVILLLVTFSVNAQVKESDLTLMPVPASVKLLDGNFRLDDSFSVFIAGQNSERLTEYAQRMIHRLSDRTGFFLKNPFVQCLFLLIK